MSEPCDRCGCGLSDPEIETEVAEIPSDREFANHVREFVLEHLDSDDEDTFIQTVEVCPEKVTVEYQDRS